MRTPTHWARPKRLKPPGFIKPCQPILARAVPTGDGWLHELKHDGYRVLAFKDGERAYGPGMAATFGRVIPPSPAAIACPPLSGASSRYGEQSRTASTGLARLSPADVTGRPLSHAFDSSGPKRKTCRGVEPIGRRRMLQKAAL